jgi:hypothetical protein
VQNWWDSLPRITRFMAGACFLTTLASYLGIVSPWSIVILRPKILQEYQVNSSSNSSRNNNSSAADGQRAIAATPEQLCFEQAVQVVLHMLKLMCLYWYRGRFWFLSKSTCSSTANHKQQQRQQ